MRPLRLLQSARPAFPSHPLKHPPPAKRGTAAAATRRAACSSRTHPGFSPPPPRRAPWRRRRGRAAVRHALPGTSCRAATTRGSRRTGRFRSPRAAAGPRAARAPRAPAADPSGGPGLVSPAGGSARPRLPSQPSRLGLVVGTVDSRFFVSNRF